MRGTSIRSAGHFTPRTLHTRSSVDVASAVHQIMEIAGTAQHADLLRSCLAKLDLFRVTRQLRTLDRVFGELPGGLCSCK